VLVFLVLIFYMALKMIRVKLTKGKDELSHGDEKILDGKKELADGKKRLFEANIELSEGKKRLDDGHDELAAGWKLFYFKTEKGGISGFFRDTFFEDEVREAQEKLQEGSEKLKAGRKRYDEGMIEFIAGQKKYDEGMIEYIAGQRRYDEGVERLKKWDKVYGVGRYVIWGFAPLPILAPIAFYIF